MATITGSNCDIHTPYTCSVIGGPLAHSLRQRHNELLDGGDLAEDQVLLSQFVLVDQHRERCLQPVGRSAEGMRRCSSRARCKASASSVNAWFLSARHFSNSDISFGINFIRPP